MDVKSLYLRNATASIVKRKEVFENHSCLFFSAGEDYLGVIFICSVCLSYFKSLFGEPRFCFEEFRKYLLEGYLREG